MPEPGNPANDRAPGQQFLTTHWTLILAARSDGPEGRAALEQLCQSYWPPLFVYARRNGCSPHDAQDLVQAFITQLLARRDWGSIAPEKGRFRSFLLTAFKNFMVSGARHDHAEKRGGQAFAVSLDVEEPEGLCAPELTDSLSPDKAFDRSWARQIMTRALRRLADEHQSPTQARLFAALQPALVDGGRVVQEAQTAARLGLTPGALAVAATRLRRRYRGLIEDEVKQTLANPADLAEELRGLWLAWS